MRRWGWLRMMGGMSLCGVVIAVGACIAPPAGTGTGSSSTNEPPAEDQLLPANQAPRAYAGNDQVARAGDLVRLDGAASADNDGDRLSFIWQQTSGPVVELGGRFSSIARFPVPAGAVAGTTFTFSLTVTDGFVVASDDVQVTIVP